MHVQESGIEHGGLKLCAREHVLTSALLEEPNLFMAHHVQYGLDLL